MSSTFSNLKLELISDGEQAGTWGITTNTNLGTAIEEAITGSADVTFSGADITLTLANTNAAQIARNLRLNLVGTSGGARQLVLGSGCQIDKLYLIQNNLADAVTVRNTSGTGVTVLPNRGAFVFNDGTNVVEAIPFADVSQTAAQTLTNKTIAFGSNTLTDVASTNTAQTLTNKTLTSPVISTISNTGTITLPTATDTLVGRDTTDTLTNKTIAFGSNTLTNVASTNTTQTLTNKTIAFSSNTLTNVASTNTTQTLTNKTIALGSNTVSGTLAEFNTALSDGSFATLAGTETLTNKTLTSPVLGGAPDQNGSYRSNIVAVAALDIDCTLGNYFTKTINADSTFTFSNPPASRAYAFTLELTHTSGTVTWPTSVGWPENVAPTLTTGRAHLFVFVTSNGGTAWRGAALVDYIN
jgi:hypothetical protein